MKTVIIAEKPDQARKYAKALGDSQSKQGYIEVKTDVFPGEVFITWCIGHLVQLSEPHEYDDKYKKWDKNDLPFLPANFKYKVSPSVKSQYNIVKGLLKPLTSNDQIVIATDPDREGEAIAYYVLKLLGISKPTVKRLWANTQEPGELKNFFKKLRDGSETYKYYVEAESRGISDYLVGMNFTRLATILLQNKGVRTQGAFSVGRVQTPTLFMVYNREKEIENFKQTTYYDLVADGEKDETKFQLKSSERFSDEGTLSQFIQEHGLKDAQGKVSQVTRQQKLTKAPKLFKLGGIQKVGNNKWGYSLDTTLKHVQSLYDKGFLSYPRTDSNLITTAEFQYLKDNVDNYKNLLGLNFEVAYAEPRKAYVDDEKVLEHYAVVPTKTIPTKAQYEGLSQDEKNIYEAVVKQTMAIFAEDYSYEQTKVTVDVQDVQFNVTGNTPLNQGWKNLSNEDEEEKEPVLPDLFENEVLSLHIHGKEGKTKPPAYLTEASLGGEGGLMETCGKKLDDENMKEHLSSGIGTPATRGAIVKGLIDKGYITVDKKKLHTTDKGKILCQALDGSLISSAEMTGVWEEKLAGIAKGEETQEAFIDGIKEYIKVFHSDLPKLIDDNVKTESIAAMQTDDVLGKCPKCQTGSVKHVKTKDKEFYPCSERCGFVIWGSMLGKKITPTLAKQLITNGKTGVVKGLQGKKNKFDAALKLKDDYTVGFDFEK